MTNVGSQSESPTAELFPRMLALCLSHQWSKLACCRISNSCYLLALLDPLMRRSLLSGMEKEPAHRVALCPGYSSPSEQRASLARALTKKPPREKTPPCPEI